MGTQIIISMLALTFLGISGAACAFAVLYEPIRDTFLQRVGLAGMALGLMAIAVTIMDNRITVGPVAWFSGFSALFGLETLRVLLFKRGSK